MSRPPSHLSIDVRRCRSRPSHARRGASCECGKKGSCEHRESLCPCRARTGIYSPRGGSRPQSCEARLAGPPDRCKQANVGWVWIVEPAGRSRILVALPEDVLRRLGVAPHEEEECLIAAGT